MMVPQDENNIQEAFDRSNIGVSVTEGCRAFTSTWRLFDIGSRLTCSITYFSSSKRIVNGLTAPAMLWIDAFTDDSDEDPNDEWTAQKELGN